MTRLLLLSLLLLPGGLPAEGGLPSILPREPVKIALPEPPVQEGRGYLWWYPRLAAATRPSGCIHHPSCTRYASRAVESHGWARGVLLALDRLYREPGDLQHAHRVRTPQGTRVYDPIEHNTFWWTQHARDSSVSPYRDHLLFGGWTGRLR